MKYTIEEDDFNLDDWDEFDDNRALAVFLIEEIVFLSGSDYLSPFKPRGEDPDKLCRPTCAPLVICNDQFYWACADCEPLPASEIESLYKMWKADPRWGVTKWCCRSRNMRPQIPIVNDMKKEGVWDDELESLPAPEPS